MTFDLIVSIFFSLIGIVLVIVLAYFSSKWLGKRYSGLNSGKNLKIIERIMLGKESSIVLAELLGEKYLIGVTSKEIILLKELGEIPIEVKEENMPQFAEIFMNSMSKQLGMIRGKIAGRKNNNE